MSRASNLTREYLIIMPGIRRHGVTEACVFLRDRGFIDYSRGQIQIPNREGLESVACECYGAVKAEFDRLFGNQKEAR
jgi:hypothetical protein